MPEPAIITGFLDVSNNFSSLYKLLSILSKFVLGINDFIFYLSQEMIEYL